MLIAERICQQTVSASLALQRHLCPGRQDVIEMCSANPLHVSFGLETLSALEYQCPLHAPCLRGTKMPPLVNFAIIICQPHATYDCRHTDSSCVTSVLEARSTTAVADCSCMSSGHHSSSLTCTSGWRKICCEVSRAVDDRQ